MASTAAWTVCEAAAEDLPRIMPVMQAAFDPQYGEAWTLAQCEAVFALAGCRLALVEADGIAAGFALTRSVIDETELLLLAVHPRFQGRGIGEALLRDAIEHSRNAGTARIFLEVRQSNNAVHFYEQIGFTRTGIRRDYYRSRNGQSFDALTFSMSAQDIK